MIDRQAFVTTHFQWRELIRDCDADPLPEILENLRYLAQALESIRTKFGNQPVHINSGFRTAEHNREIGGAPHSQHLIGKAADIVIEGVTPHEVQALLKEWPGGLGSYSTWTHVDNGPKRRWSGP